jgi:hypothetical protein
MLRYLICTSTVNHVDHLGIEEADLCVLTYVIAPAYIKWSHHSVILVRKQKPVQLTRL